MEKYRHEIKYICNNAELEIMESRLRCLMKPDNNIKSDGRYVVRSVYFDDCCDSGYYDNENGVNPREKFRIRIYDLSDEYIVLEKKIKNKDRTLKKSIRIDKTLCKKLLENADCDEYKGINGLLDELLIKRKTALMKPKIVVEYVRTPYIYDLGNVRITFDRNIAASGYSKALFEKSLPKMSILPTGLHILEVKYDEFIPDTIFKCLDTGHLDNTSFSKYYLSRKAMKGRI